MLSLHFTSIVYKFAFTVHNAYIIIIAVGHGVITQLFISDLGVFFGAFLGPINILLSLVNVVIFLYAGFVITSLKHKQERMKKAAHAE